MKKETTTCLLAFWALTSLWFSCGLSNEAEKLPSLQHASHENLGDPEASAAIENGDIIFQTSLSDQSRAIQLATKSKYSHCGIVYKKDSAFYVLEAVQPVKYTKLEDWVQRGDKGEYVIKRLRDAKTLLTDENLLRMQKVGEQLKGKNYDLAFEWSDEKVYCSELVWKVYERGLGIELAKLERLDDFDLRSPEVKSKLKERYGDKLPVNEPVISPSALFESSLLYTVR